MNNQTLFRVGSIAAIVAAVLTIAFPILFFSGNDALVTAATIIIGVLTLVIMLPLSLDLSTESQGVVVAAALLLGGSTIWGFFLEPINVNPPIFGTSLLMAGLGFALYGWLQYRSSRYPSGMGFVILLNGLVHIIAAISMISGIGAESLASMAIPLITILQLVWLIWLGRHYLRSRPEIFAAA
ncbi:MAG: hypothetical protein R3300_20780 [Candidatus Promineifilaceae bacterium]|nr:hypothetical protein [Candidatus Promineifilaceae bacterium]